MKNNADHTDLRELIETLLEDDHRLVFRMKGYSMFPLLRPGDKGVVEKCDPRDLRRGDIIVFYLRGMLVAHRMMQRRGDSFLAKGDNNPVFDPLINPSEFVGKLSSNHPNSFRMKLFAFWALHFTFLFTFINRIHYRISTLRTSLKKHWADFKNNFDFASRDVKGLFYLNTTISVLQGLIPFAVILLIKLLVDLLNTLPGRETMPPMFVFLLILTGVAFLLSSVLSELKSWYSEKLSQGVARSVYARMHLQHIKLELSHYENSKELDKMHRAVQEASFRPMKLLNEVQHFLRSVAASLFLVGIFVSIRWYLVFILFVAILPGIVLKLRFSRRYHRLKEQQSPLERRMYYFNRVLTSYPFAKEMKLFGFARFFVKRFRGLQDEIFKGRMHLRGSEVRQNIAAQTFAVLIIFITLGLVAHWMVAGMLSIGTVVMFFFAFQRGYSVLNDLFKSMASLQEDSIFLNDLFLMINDGERETTKPSGSETTKSSGSETTKSSGSEPTKPSASETTIPFSLQRSICVEDVSFRYVNSKRDALRSVNLTIPAGQTVAVVGANGSGKTTLIKLLCGFYLPDKGAIYYDNSSTADLGRETICRNLSAVFQDFALYNVSANENIALGNIHREFSAVKVQESAQQAGISSVLEELPQGYSTLLGNQFLGGEELSIGQWQKLAISRAFYRDKPLLLMDEPSSALDAISEQQIIETLKALAHSKTAVIISHRLSTVKWADRIIVFDEGRVVEEGSHEELLMKNGKYAELYRETTKSFEK